MYVRSYIFITQFPRFRHWWLKLETHEKPTKTHKNGVSRELPIGSYGNYAQKLHTMPLSDRGNFLRIKTYSFEKMHFFVSKNVADLTQSFAHVLVFMFWTSNYAFQQDKKVWSRFLKAWKEKKKSFGQAFLKSLRPQKIIASSWKKKDKKVWSSFLKACYN